MSRVELKAGGSHFGGWKAVRVIRGLDQIAGAFYLEVSDRWAGQDLPRKIVPGDSCELLLDGKPVIVGWVDELNVSYDAGSHNISVAGRDATGDLVDCAAISGAGQWNSRTISQIAADLCKPFGVRVRVDEGVDVGRPFAAFALQEGETVFEALDRMARMRGLWLMSDGAGGVLITRVAKKRSGGALQLGVNILSASAQLDFKERFSRYIVKGQAPGSDTLSGTYASQIKREATDPAVRRYRPTIVLAEGGADGPASVKDRALWQSRVNAARSLNISVTVQGWSPTGGVGTLWEPNRLVRVDDEWLGIQQQDLLIKQVIFSLSDKGTTTELALTMPDAFELLPLKESSGDQFDWTLGPK